MRLLFHITTNRVGLVTASVQVFVPCPCPVEDAVLCPSCSRPTVVDHVRSLADGGVSRSRSCQCGEKLRTVEYPAPLAAAKLPVEPTLTLRGAAAMLGISPSTVMRYVQKGTIPGLRIGHRWVIREADVRTLTKRSASQAWRSRPRVAALTPDAV